MRAGLIVLSSVLTISAIFPYLFDIVKKKTKPRAVSWFTWAVLAAIAASASWSDQQYASAIMSICATVECGLVVLLGIIYYGDKTISSFDIGCQITALIGLLLWYLFNSPALAIAAVILIDLVASLPTVRHAWERPDEETKIAFLGSGLGALCTLLAAESIRITSVANPIYIVSINFAIYSTLVMRQKLQT